MSAYSRHLLVIAGLLLASCDVGVQTYRSSEGDPPSVGAFVDFIEEGDVESFVADLNKVRRNDPESEILTFLRSLWEETRVEGPSTLLQNDLVLVELAATLAQAQRNRAIDLDEQELHEFIRGTVSSNDLEVRQRALFGLAIFEDPSDIPVLEQMAGSPDEATYRTVVVALSSMCVSEAGLALERIEPLLSKERLAFLAETRARYRDKTCPASRPDPASLI